MNDWRIEIWVSKLKLFGYSVPIQYYIPVKDGDAVAEEIIESYGHPILQETGRVVESGLDEVTALEKCREYNDEVGGEINLNINILKSESIDHVYFMNEYERKLSELEDEG